MNSSREPEGEKWGEEEVPKGGALPDFPNWLTSALSAWFLNAFPQRPDDSVSKSPS